VRDLPKVHASWIELDLNPSPFARKAPNLPMSHHAPDNVVVLHVGGCQGTNCGLSIGEWVYRNCSTRAFNCLSLNMRINKSDRAKNMLQWRAYA